MSDIRILLPTILPINQSSSYVAVATTSNKATVIVPEQIYAT